MEKENGTEIVPINDVASINVESLISQGMEKGLSIDSLKELLAMRTQLKEEWAKEQFFTALSKFESECPTIQKKKDVFNKEGKLRYSYAPLEDIIEQVKNPLKENGFSYTFKNIQDKASGTLTVICEAHHAAGHTEETEVTVPVGSEYMTAQQVVGSAITFAKRYAFCNAFGITTGDADDDGQGAPEDEKPDAKPDPKQKEPEKKEPPPLPACYVELKAIFEKMTEGLDDNGKTLAFNDTIKRHLGKTVKQLTYLNVPECEKVIAALKAEAGDGK